MRTISDTGVLSLAIAGGKRDASQSDVSLDWLDLRLIVMDFYVHLLLVARDFMDHPNIIYLFRFGNL